MKIVSAALACLAVLLAAPVSAAALPRAAMHPSAFAAPRTLTLASTHGTFAGTMAPGEPVSILVRLAGRRDAELDRFVASLQSGTSLSPRYLTPQEYGYYFGADPLVYGRAIAALRSAGFTIDDLPANRTDIVAHAPASRVAAFFATPLDRRVENGRVFFTARYEPQVPAALAAVAISGLDDYVRFHPLGLHRRSPNGQVNGSWSPADLAAGYDLNALYAKGLNGNGTIVANATSGAARAVDVATFQAHFGLPKVPMVSTGVGGALQTGCGPQCDNGESSLDAASATSIARGATFHQVVAHVPSNHDFDLAYEYIVNNLGSSVHVVTTSWGVCERFMGKNELAIDNGDFKQAVAEGQFWFSASGDGGTDDCAAKGPISVDYPGSSWYVVSVGGTNVAGNTSGGNVVSWAGETTWQYANSNGASGGGQSLLYAKPSYQMGVTPSKYTARLVPDVALIADPDNDGVYLCDDGQIQGGWGGTSEASPMWAGFLAIVEQNKIAKGQKLIDPHLRLYQLAKTSAYKTLFHDIVSGYNGAPNGVDPYGTFPGYYAGPGFDLTTGLGSFAGAKLLAAY